MPAVFLSYSSKDHVFADLVEAKLTAAGIRVWRDQTQLRAGTDWRQEIEQNISDSVAVLVVLSPNSAESSYVTFEWAYALGKEKVLIPIKLGDCVIHRRLEAIQHFDHAAAGWNPLIELILEIESEPPNIEKPPVVESVDDGLANAILGYLDRQGFQMMSFERIRSKIKETVTDEQLKELIARKPMVFRLATVKGGKPGIAKRVP